MFHYYVHIFTIECLAFIFTRLILLHTGMGLSNLSLEAHPYLHKYIYTVCNACPYIKMRGPFVQTLCIEKDSYMDAI